MKGKIRKYVINRGYGFIDGEDGQPYFFHITNTNLNPHFRYEIDGVEVEFDPVEERDGIVIKAHAENVRIITETDCNDCLKGEMERGQRGNCTDNLKSAHHYSERPDD